MALSDDRVSAADRLRRFSSQLPRQVLTGVGTRLNLMPFLHLAIDVERNPPYQASTYYKAYELTGYARPAP